MSSLPRRAGALLLLAGLVLAGVDGSGNLKVGRIKENQPQKQQQRRLSQARPIADALSNLSPELSLVFFNRVLQQLSSLLPQTLQSSLLGQKATDTTTTPAIPNLAEIIPQSISTITSQFQALQDAITTQGNGTAGNAFCTLWMASRLAQNTVASATYDLAAPAASAILATPVAQYISDTVARMPMSGAEWLDNTCEAFAPAENQTVRAYLQTMIGTDAPIATALGAALAPFERFASQQTKAAAPKTRQAVYDPSSNPLAALLSFFTPASVPSTWSWPGFSALASNMNLASLFGARSTNKTAGKR